MLCCHAPWDGCSLVLAVVGPRACDHGPLGDVCVPSATSGPLPYLFMPARWRRYGRGVIASGHKKEFYSKYRAESDTFLHLTVLCVCLPRNERRRFFYITRFNVFFSQNVHVVARSLTDQLANREQLLAR